MPRTVKGEDGKDVEVFDKSELEAAQKTAAEAKEKELESSISPNWRDTRKKLAEQEQAIKDRDAKLAELGVKGEPKGIDAAEVEKIAEKKFLDRYKNRILDTYGDKKEVVAKYFEKLSTGETLDEASIERLADDAARAAGVATKGVTNGAMFGRGGSRPEFENKPIGTEEGFGASEAGKATAKAMGIMLDNPNKK